MSTLSQSRWQSVPGALLGVIREPSYNVLVLFYMPALAQAGWYQWMRRCLVNWTWKPGPGPVRVWLCIADHFEPYWRHADPETARERVALWRREWPRIAESCRDSSGLPARYTFFYPAEAYDASLMDSLAEMSRLGCADVEVHYHHGGESVAQFQEAVGGFVETLHRRHGLFRRRNGQLAFGFIHGDWALDNSLPNGQCCGLNNELTLLRDLGCYADFTMPAGESPAQARMINQIYWAHDDPALPKSYDRGTPLLPGRRASGDLLLIPGPFGARPSESWYRRRSEFSFLSRYVELTRELRLETGELASYDPPSPERTRCWFRIAPRLGNDLFFKLYAHGAQERHSEALLGGDLQRMFGWVAEECKARGWQYHFASAWQLFRAVEALGEGRDPVAAALA